MNIFRRVTLRSERTEAHLLSSLVKVFFLSFHEFFSMSFEENFIPSLYILCRFFRVFCWNCIFKRCYIKTISSGALPPRINCFSSLTRLTSLELTHRRTMFRKHGIWASIPAMMATLELQFPMIRFFYNISSSKYAKLHANKLWLSQFLLAVWLRMPGASEFSANNKAAKHTTYRV